MRRPLVLALALMLALLSGAGCGGDDGDAPNDELLQRLPADPQFLSAVDLDDAREALGLPEDADPTASGEKERRLLFAAAHALPHLERVAGLPILDAMDHTKVREAATAGGRITDRITVVRTDQAAREVLDGLVERGYKRRGELVVGKPPYLQLVYGAAAAADGLLVLGGSPEAVQRALGGEGGDARGDARSLLDGLDGPVRVAVNSTGTGCLRGLAGVDLLDPAEGELKIRVRGGADPERVLLEREGDPLARVADYDEAEPEGDLLRVPFTYRPDPSGLTPLALARGIVPPDAVYRCEGG